MTSICFCMGVVVFDDEVSKKRRKPVVDAHEIRPPMGGGGLGKDGMFAGVFDKAGKLLSKSRDGSLYTRRSMNSFTLGIPSPSLAFSYGMGINVIPLGRFWQIVGKMGSFKSALGFDLQRQVIEHAETGSDYVGGVIPGIVTYDDTEIKFASDFYWSFLGHRDDYVDVVEIRESPRLEDWTAGQFNTFKRWDEIFKGVGWITPLFMGVDSISGGTSQAEIDRMDKAGGVPSVGPPITTNLASKYAATLPSKLVGKPVLYVAVNHLKMFTDFQTMMPKRNVPGGSAFQFAESMELELTRVSDIKHATLPGATVRITFYKNCFGDSRNRISVDVRWMYDYVDEVDESTGETRRHKRQWSMWDWPSASITLLESIKAGGDKRGGDKRMADSVAEIIDLNVSQGRVWSSALGISSKDKLSVHEAGCVLEDNPAILEALMPVLGIRQGVFFKVGTDFAAERFREDVRPSSMRDRVFRRPKAGGLASRVANDVSERVVEPFVETE